MQIKNVDFRRLENQKQILINMILDWGESDDPQQRRDAKEVEGLLKLINEIQNPKIKK
jgi:hypothetical protein